ncbi:TetR family transcriptional regulator [Solicola gregarius]|uniref:TetR family transcriptional regulator n=1 Tax=Solicola gregarius TaxID=2908642 RepID=A0AA46TI39_9ACTN|nr:TetR family transcriptional regulator [Solicola gregarius]UYM05555.1 TetR family transcriptional regulator [Solicola gregarius]
MRTRQEQKERTRRVILDAALQLTGEYGFGGLSLRQVTRASGIVPTAFYRHFASMHELGLALVGESFETLRAMTREARRDPRTFDDVIATSAEILVRVVKERPEHFAFIARERFGGVAEVRDAIRHELELFVSELAVDLARFPYIEDWTPADVQMVAKLFVNNMVGTAEDIVEVPPGRPDLEQKVAEQAKRQMRLIAIGFKDWKSQ